MKQLVWSDFTGGLNLNEPTLIKDNELAKADNVFYDDDQRLTSRRGIQDIFEPIPDTVTVIASMNTYNGDGTWTAAGDASNVTSDTTYKKYDAGSVNFDIVVAGTSANIYNTGITAVDLTAVKETGYFGFWAYLPVVTDLTSATLTLGDTLDTKDYELAVTTQANGDAFEVGWNYLKYDWASMTDTGSPTGSIDEIRITLTYAAAYAGATDFRIDCIAWNSATYTKGIHSLYHVKLDDGTRLTLAGCGTNVFKLVDDNDFVLLKGGFTDGEKFSFINYKNVIYFSNGTDNFSYYTPAFESAAGSIVTADASAPKAKYLIIVANTAFAAGIYGDLNKIAYTDILPTDLTNTYWTEYEYVFDDDSREVITGLGKLANDAIAAFMTNSAYYVDVLTGTVRPLDYDGGCTGHRTIQRVGDDLFFLAEDALYSLAQREEDLFGSTSLSDNVKPLIVTGSDLSTANALKGKHTMTSHYYLNIDTEGSGVPDTCLVYNTRMKTHPWTKYTNVRANQMIEYQDSDDVWHIIYANAYSGQTREIEKDFDDNGVEINVKVWTKENDFGDPTLYKDVRECDISGFISELAEINITDELDGTDNITDTIEGDDYTGVSTSVLIGNMPIGEDPLTGGAADTMEMYLFNVRKNIYQACVRVQIKLESSVAGTAWILSKIQFQATATPIDFFPNDNYI